MAALIPYGSTPYGAFGSYGKFETIKTFVASPKAGVSQAASQVRSSYQEDPEAYRQAGSLLLQVGKGLIDRVKGYRSKGSVEYAPYEAPPVAPAPSYETGEVVPQEQGLPEWVLPVGIIGALGLVGLLLARSSTPAPMVPRPNGRRRNGAYGVIGLATVAAVAGTIASVGAAVGAAVRGGKAIADRRYAKGKGRRYRREQAQQQVSPMPSVVPEASQVPGIVTGQPPTMNYDAITAQATQLKTGAWALVGGLALLALVYLIARPSAPVVVREQRQEAA